MQKEAIHTTTHRVITMLNRQEIDFLDKIGKDALFSTGHKLSYNEILRALIDFAMEIGVSGEKIDSLEHFKETIVSRMLKDMAVRQKEEGPDETHNP